MFDRFTDRARKVMGLARQEAQRLNHEYIGTEHILLGLVQEGSGVAANVLKNLDIDLKKIRQEVEKIVKTGPSMVTMGQLPFTPRAKKVLELALEEASNLGHNYIGTEHILLGLIKEQDGKAAKVLQNLGVKLDTVREEVLDFLGAELPTNEGEKAETAGGGGTVGGKQLAGMRPPRNDDQEQHQREQNPDNGHAMWRLLPEKEAAFWGRWQVRVRACHSGFRGVGHDRFLFQ